MKKALAALLVLIVLSVTAGCGSKKDDLSSSLSGTWYTASMGYEYYGQSQAEYYVHFTDTTIDYGHMKDEEFVLDHSDTISSIEEIGTDRYRIKAVTASGYQYSYETGETGEENSDVLNYYMTWNEEEFSENYSAGASLWKSKK